MRTVSTIKVYRVQNASGLGPYQDAYLSDVRHSMYAAHIDMDHPTPQLDGMAGSFRYYHVCGCVSRQALRKWFYGYLRNLRKEGYFTVEIEIDPRHVMTGLSNRQVAFNPTLAVGMRRLT